ncbi:MAG: pyruvate ferredoxin oxidoreductase [Thermoleophilia bacterium]|nr:pyruvate ferredoxin oxidoreductase [Thermoleophilia bacterium]
MSVCPGPAVVSVSTGCLEVSTTIYPYTAWKDSMIHSAFENAGATISGVETAYNSLKKQGKIKDDMYFVAFGGDGGTYDIGLQSLSGAVERGHNFVYVCYDNGAYMNTGFQRSSATPYGAWTTTSPVGKESAGKQQNRKDLTAILVAHDIPYAATASPHNFKDLMNKAEKAFATPGPAFINVISPCPRGWRTPGDQTIALAKEAVQSCYWPLYEVENGKYKINYKPKGAKKTPVADWLKKQGRFAHLFKPGNEAVLADIQDYIDRKWEELLKKEECL